MIIKIVTKDIYLKKMLNILRIYIILTRSYSDAQKAKETKCEIKQRIKFEDKKNVYKIMLMISQDPRKSLKVKHTNYLMKRLTKLHEVLMIIKDYSHSNVKSYP